VGNDLSVISSDFKRLNAMQDASTRWPELDFLDELKKGNLLPIINSFGYLLRQFFPNLMNELKTEHSLARSPGVTPGNTDLESVLILPIGPPEVSYGKR
jgi:hypothetical protein